jgi:diguanylate cyclase (GGDEF)-like protein
VGEPIDQDPIQNPPTVDLDDTRDALSQDVYRALVETLYTSMSSLIMGALIGSMMTGAMAYFSHNALILYCFYLISLVGFSRIITFILYKRKIYSSIITAKRWERTYEIGAWLYAILLGVASFLAITVSGSFAAQILAASVTPGYTAGIAGRNAGRPNIAYVQVILAALPSAIGYVILFTPVSLLLAIAQIASILASFVITNQTNRGVVMAFSEKYQKAALADSYLRLANSDPLTGLDNRLKLTQHLQETMARVAMSNKSSVAVFWIDLDFFKEINDTLGHPIGDKVLCETARRLQGLVNTRGHVARFGGDEFVLVVEVADINVATALAESVVKLLTTPFADGQHHFDMSGSVGVSLSAFGQDDHQLLLQQADIALYEAKAAGRHGFAVFDQLMAERLQKQREMREDFKRALTGKQFEVYYQPIVDISTHEAVSYEALVRWHHPVYGIISPTVFIPIAESLKLIEPLTQWVINAACQVAVTWPEDMKLNVNISPSLLKGRALSQIIHSALLNSGLRARQLCLEITETVLIDENVNAIVMLREFKRMGMTLSLDDFGTGYSSLSYVCKYAFNSLKIDRSFVTEVERSSESRAVVDAVMGLGKALGLTIVAEGIETEVDRAYMERAGCRYAQGYLFGRPEPAHRIYHLMRSRDDYNDGLFEQPSATINERRPKRNTLSKSAAQDADDNLAKPDLKLIANGSRQRV